MASYISGITDFIPQIQPFSPDLNFYEYALRTKEDQYQAGYDKISNLYGTLLNSELLREPNREKRDKFFQQVQGEIQRLSTVDLSLEENIDAAYKIFQPLINDRNITNDIAKTKIARAQQQRGQQLRNCINEKDCGGLKGWDTGDKAINYWMDEFSKSDDATALDMDAPSYAAYTDAGGKAMKMAKELGIQITDVSFDRSGQYRITTTNGTAMQGPLYEYFVGALKNDPAITNMYKAQAYVDRKDFSKYNAQQYGGEDKAEAAYLNSRIDYIYKEQSRLAAEADRDLNLINSRKEALTNQLKDTGITEQDSDATDEFVSLLRQAAGMEEAKTQYSNTVNYVDRNNLLGIDLKALRKNVDEAVAGSYFSNDMVKAAISYATLTSKEEYKADEYALTRYKHKLDMQEQYQKHLHDLDRDSENAKYKLILEQYKDQTGGASLDPRTDQWEIAPQTAGSTQEVPLSVTNEEEIQRRQTTARGIYDQYYNESLAYYTAASKNPKLAKWATAQKAALEGAFKGNDYKKNYARLVTLNKNNEINIKRDNIAYNNKFRELEKAYSEEEEFVTKGEDILRSNRKKIVEYQSQFYKGTELADADLLIDDKGNWTGPVAFAQKWMARYPNKQFDTDIYEDIEAEYITLSNSNAVNVESLIGATGGGTVHGVPIRIKADPAAYTSLGHRVMMDAFEDYRTNITNPQLKVLSGSGHTVDELGETDEASKNTLEFIFQEMSKPTKFTKDNRPIADIIFQGVAANDRNLIAVTLEVDPGWIKKNAGTAKNKGLTYDLQSNNKITMYIPRSSAANLGQIGARSKYDMMLKTGIDIDEYQDGGGKLTIQGTPGGNVTISGHLTVVNDKTGEYENGTWTKTFIPQNTEAAVTYARALLKKNESDNQKDRELIKRGLPKQSFNQWFNTLQQ